MSAFSAALNGVRFTYSTSSQTSDPFHLSQSNKRFIVFVTIGPVTALKRQTKMKRETCVGFFAKQIDNRRWGKGPQHLQTGRGSPGTGGGPSRLLQSVNTPMWCTAACSSGRQEDQVSNSWVFLPAELVLNALFCQCHVHGRGGGGKPPTRVVLILLPA